jgi:hypothetical protein
LAIHGTLAWWITNWAVARWAAATASRYLAIDYTVDSGVLLYLFGISLITVPLSSLAPISMIVRLGQSGVLNTETRWFTQGLRLKRLGRLMVAGQMALSIILSGAGILVRSLLRIVNAETGVHDAEHLLVGSLRLPTDAYVTPEPRCVLHAARCPVANGSGHPRRIVREPHSGELGAISGVRDRRTDPRARARFGASPVRWIELVPGRRRRSNGRPRVQ